MKTHPVDAPAPVRNGTPVPALVGWCGRHVADKVDTDPQRSPVRESILAGQALPPSGRRAKTPVRVMSHD